LVTRFEKQERPPADKTVGSASTDTTVVAVKTAGIFSSKHA